jgi:hypothetical protein
MMQTHARQPISIDTLRQLLGARSIWIWGAGNQGRGMAHVLQHHAFTIAGFLDQAADALPNPLLGLPVLSPTSLITNADFANHYFVLIAAYFFEQAIATQLNAAGLQAHRDFLSYSALKPIDYSIDIVGACNLKCLACPRAASRPNQERKSGLMPFTTFQKILDKILIESPFVGNVQLYQWGEPVLHPHLPEMLSYARERGIACAISSNLNAAVDYERIIAAQPEWLRISASGWGDDYTIAHTQGRWDRFINHLHAVAHLRNSYYPQMKIELYYHLYRHSLGTAYQRFQALATELALEFHPIPAYLIGLDDVLGYCEGRSLPDTARRAAELLLVSLDDGIALAQQESSATCNAWRCVNINWDGSVSQCLLYYDQIDNIAAPHYLETSLLTIQQSRYESRLCHRCMQHGLHNYCDAYARVKIDPLLNTYQDSYHGQ